MSRRIGFATSVVSFCLVAFLAAGPSWAEDDDLNTQVYLEFDPETGEFVTVEEPSKVKPQKHEPQAGAAPSTQRTAAASDQKLVLLAGSVLGLGLLGAAALWLRKS